MPSGERSIYSGDKAKIRQMLFCGNSNPMELFYNLTDNITTIKKEGKNENSKRNKKFVDIGVK